MITVPDAFASATIGREGAAGRAWIATLPTLVQTLCQRWRLVVDGPPMHGYLGVIVPVMRGTQACVLKVSWPDPSARDEAVALAAWQGRGAVRLYTHEPSQAAMLLERLDPHQSLRNVDVGTALAIAGRVLRRLAIPDPGGLPMQSTMTRELVGSLPERWERFGRPLPRVVLEQVCELALRHGGSSQHRMVNYDLHYADVLAGEREAWLAVDPKVVIGDVEFGVAQLVWRRLEDIEAHSTLDDALRVLTEAAELDEPLTRAWLLVRCVDYWLWGLSIGLTHDPARCERIVTWLVA